MGVSRRELEFLVKAAITNTDEATLISIAETVLDKKVFKRRGRYSLSEISNEADVMDTRRGSPSPQRSAQRVRGVTTAGMKVLKAFDTLENDTFDVEFMDFNTLRLRCQIKSVHLSPAVEKLLADGLLSFRPTHGGRLYQRTAGGVAAAHAL